VGLSVYVAPVALSEKVINSLTSLSIAVRTTFRGVAGSVVPVTTKSILNSVNPSPVP